MMRLSSLRVTGALFCALVVFACATVTTSEADREELPFDPTVRLGRLDNGLTYYIRPNGTPAGQAELILAIDAGSVLEREDQRGLAHVTEHMAFNGTAAYPGNQIIETLETLGIGFGAHANASTGLDETIYFIRVPTEEEKLRIGLHILEQWAHAVSFESEEIEKERGVVLEEWRLSLGAHERIRTLQLPVLLRGSRYANRLPIGDPEILRTFEHSTLRDFYRTWYRPDLMSVIAVGDFDPDAMEGLIHEYFAPIPARDQPVERPEVSVPLQEDTRFSIVFDPEATSTRVLIIHQIEPIRLINRGDYRARTMESLYGIMLNRRLERIAAEPDAPFLAASAGVSSFVREGGFAVQFATVEEERIEQAVRSLVIETRRVAEHGFGESEFRRAKENLLRGVEQAYEERDTRESSSYANEYVRHFLEREASPGIEYEVSLTRQLVEEIELQEIDRLAELFLSSRDRTIWISGPSYEGFEPPMEGRLAEALSEAALQPVAAYIDPFDEGSLIAIPPVGGTVVSESYREDLDTTTWLLSNGARVVIKPSDFRDDEILFEAYSWGGLSRLPEAEWQSARNASEIVVESGLGDLSRTELQEQLGDKRVLLSPGIGIYREGMYGSASATDVETLLQLIHLYFTMPREDPDAFRSYIRKLATEVRNRTRNPLAGYQDRITELYFGNHPLTRPHTPDTVAEIDLQVALNVFRGRYLDADDFVFFFVGDIEIGRLRSLVETYLAGLPSQDSVETPTDLDIPYAQGVVRDSVQAGRAPQGGVSIIFHGPHEWSRENNYLLRSLSEVMDIVMRETIREEAGGSYDIGVFADVSRLPRQRYFLQIRFGADPERVDELIAGIFEVIGNLRSNPIDPDYIERVRNTQLNQYDIAIMQNEFWLASLQEYDQHGLDPALLLRFEQLTQLLTPEALGDAARRYLDLGRYLQVTFAPEDG